MVTVQPIKSEHYSALECFGLSEPLRCTVYYTTELAAAANSRSASICPSLMSDCVKLSVIRLGSDWVTGAPPSTHQSTPQSTTSASCGEPCAHCETARLMH